MAQTSPVEQGTGNRLVFEDSVEVQAPLEEVYGRWNNFTRFPEFMNNVEEVTPIGGDRYHWVARIFGIKQEWDADVIERDPQQRISWRSVNGAYNTGTVSFNALDGSKTEVRLRLEYAPPAGQIGKQLDKITQTTKRQVHEDLHNFKRTVSGSNTGVQRADVVNQQGQTSVGSLMAQIGVAAGAAAAGGVATYYIGDRLFSSRAFAAVRSPVSPPFALGGWILTGACGASIVGAAALRLSGRMTDALFVGQWAPTFLAMGALSRMLGHRGVQTNLTTEVASWSFFSACLGSILSSVVLHSMGRRDQGLFVGQWAPTFIGASLISRLFGRFIAG
ncbi:MAG: SRPBCC family protein [Ktedonobacterales bacterium]